MPDVHDQVWYDRIRGWLNQSVTSEAFMVRLRVEPGGMPASSTHVPLDDLTLTARDWLDGIDPTGDAQHRWEREWKFDTLRVVMTAYGRGQVPLDCR